MKRATMAAVAFFLVVGSLPSDITEYGRLQAIIDASCNEYKVSATWATANFWNEHSGLKNNNVPCKYGRTAHGPGGLLLATAREMGYKGPEAGLDDPAVSIPLCVAYMAKLQRRYDCDMSKVISHYKTGKAGNAEYYRRVLKIIEETGGRE